MEYDYDSFKDWAGYLRQHGVFLASILAAFFLPPILIIIGA